MRRFWIALAVVFLGSFALLGWVGSRIYQEAPPVPERVVTTGGTVVIGPGAISEGQTVWAALGGMEVGSVWGHGAYVAPDWTADWLHRELMTVLDQHSAARGERTYASRAGAGTPARARH